MKANALMIMPAYGRQYKTTEEAKADWNAGKDFKVVCGPYLSIRNIEHLKVTIECLERPPHLSGLILSALRLR